MYDKYTNYFVRIRGNKLQRESIELLIDEYKKEVVFNKQVLRLLKADKKLKEVRNTIANRQLDLKRKIKHVEDIIGNIFG